ncbi:3-isopropylmalate dehydrogenase [Dehalococcoides mccartyi]|uniref:3-isopropylmalate dehydrogenase n=1 Tax=Dehalococcoides mccartyi TaxID=61435 RepID=UPI003399EE4D
MDFKLTVLPGDGIGPEVMAEGLKVLNAVAKKYKHSFEYQYGLIGGCCIDKEGVALSPETLAMCKKSDAVLLAAVGDPRFDDPKLPVHPEDGLLALRRGLGIRKATDSMTYSEKEIERIVRVGFELARSRKKKLVSVDKANVLLSSRLWRQIVIEIAKDYPDVTVEHILVDACAMKLILAPTYFDVIVTENMFGDILTDEASMLAGSMGMLPSASLAGIPAKGTKTFGLYEPIHGSAPTIAKQNIANPIATILSIAMMLRYSCGLETEAAEIEAAVDKVLAAGYATIDIFKEGNTRLGTAEMGSQIAKIIGG